MDTNGPGVDKQKHGKIQIFLHGKQENENVVRHGLQVAIEWVEGMTGERRGYYPSMVRLVDTSVQQWMVQPTMDPVDTHVSEEQEQHGRRQQVGQSIFIDTRVELRMTTHFKKKPRSGHEGDRSERL